MTTRVTNIQRASLVLILRSCVTSTQVAWGFLNDFLFIAEALTLAPPILACAALYLGAQLSNEAEKLQTTGSHPDDWLAVFDVHQSDIAHACSLVLSGYTASQPDSTMQSDSSGIDSDSVIDLVNARSNADSNGTTAAAASAATDRDSRSAATTRASQRSSVRP
jgi:hypothetical protein